MHPTPFFPKASRTLFGTGIASVSGMDVLRSFGQIPLMFIGGVLFVLAIALVWAAVRARSRGVRNL